MSVLNFWQDNAFKVVLNNTKLTHNSAFEFVDLNNISFDEKQPNVWVAPISAYHPEEKYYWCPVWIPLFDKALPWMGSAYCENQSHSFDEWLRFEWLDEENNKVFTSWQQVIESLNTLLNQINENWQSQLENQGYILNRQAIKLQTPKESLDFNIICQAYASVYEPETQAQLSFNACLPKAEFLCAKPSNKVFNKNTFTSAVHALLLQEGELLAITSPVGTQKTEFIEAVAASKSIRASLLKQTPPTIVLFKNNAFYVYTNTIKQQPQGEHYKKALALAIDYSQSVQKTVDMLSEDEDTEELIADLQAQDEAYEKELATVIALQAECLRKNKSNLFSRLLGPNKQQKQVIQDFSDKVRALKVSRTKIHQQLVEVVETSAASIGAKNRWQEWVRENIPADQHLSFEEQFLACQAFFAKQIYDECLEGGHWESIESPIACDLLIIEDAHRLLVQEVLAPLAKAKVALFLGDNQEITALPLMSALPEEWELQRFDLADEELIEQLQYKGMLPSNGNAFTVALSNSRYQEPLEHGIAQASLSLQDDVLPEIQFHGIQDLGKSTFFQNQWSNQAQAQFIAKWLITGPLAASLKQTAIFTAFAAQKEHIQHALQMHDLHVDVFCVNELPDKQYDNIIFSVVYCANDPRPFVFDVGDNMLYSLQKRATRNLWIIGDLAIFDTRMHSPSGKVAKKLFAKSTLLVE
ncbi:MAG: hypothetical protein JSR17_11015 [Proteobacteria bacterium]|nr:hypothetical protein [Pseudomonadota bacterium]